MKTINLTLSACLLIFLFPATVSAQGSDSSGYHPLMTSKFNVDAKSSGLSGQIEFGQSGPRLTLTGSWKLANTDSYHQ